MNYILCYVLAINLISFVLYGIDKYKARNEKWRISEHALIVVAALGGSVGAWCGMQYFHHKTHKPKFKYGVPAIFMLQVACCVAICKYFALF